MELVFILRPHEFLHPQPTNNKTHPADKTKADLSLQHKNDMHSVLMVGKYIISIAILYYMIQTFTLMRSALTSAASSSML